MGRPSIRTAELEESILDALASGDSIRTASDRAGVGVRTVHDWLDADDGFRTAVARARAIGAEALVELGQTRLDHASLDDPEVASAAVQKAKSQAEYLRWRASCQNRREYGDKTAHEVSGPDGGPVQVQTIADLVRGLPARGEEPKS